MDEINFLQKIAGLGVLHEYFRFDLIKNLDKTCCTDSEVEVIDFDKTEEIHRGKFNALSLKSCDALKILGTNASIDFIEMKGMRQFMDRQLDADGDFNKQVSDKIYGFRLSSKIRDSVSILNNIVQSRQFDLSGSERDFYHQMAKKYIILTDISIESNPLEMLTMTLDFLGEASSSIENILFKNFDDEIKNMELPNYYNIQKPILMSCSNLANYYR